MRYFVKMHGDVKSQQITKSYARHLYQELNYGGRFGHMNAVEYMLTGNVLEGRKHTGRYTVWGSDISDKDLFRGILRAEIQPGIKDNGER